MTEMKNAREDTVDFEVLPIVDAHVHAFPPVICESRDRFLDQDLWFSTLYTTPRAKLVTIEELIVSMDRAGIERSVMCGFPWRSPEMCRLHNDYMAEGVQRYPDRLSWLGIVSPESDEAADESARCFELGARGLGEFNADAQGFDLRQSGSFAPIVRQCEERGLPLMFHVSEPVGHLYPGKGTATPDRFLQFVARYPDVPIIAAHWGGGLPFYELMPEVRELIKNVVYDSAASTFLYDFDVFRRVAELVGPDKILFGTDYPVLRQRRFRSRMEAVQLDDGVVQRIRYDNAVRVLKLNQTGERE